MDVFTPHSLEAALDVRVTHPEATPVAGGTDLMVEVNARRIRPEALLDPANFPVLIYAIGPVRWF